MMSEVKDRSILFAPNTGMLRRVYPELLRCAQDRSKRSERAQHDRSEILNSFVVVTQRQFTLLIPSVAVCILPPWKARLPPCNDRGLAEPDEPHPPAG